MHPITTIRNRKTGRVSSWDTDGRNEDRWLLKPGEARTLAEIDGPGQITHIWMTQSAGYRECLLQIFWDGESSPSVNVPLGDFFCLGNSIVNSFESALFSASTNQNNRFNAGCALNCYAPMPFAKHCRVVLVNEAPVEQGQYFYVDYETLEPQEIGADTGYFHAEFRRTNPFGGWGPEITVNTPQANAVCKEKWAWDHNYVILETQGRGHYIGCNLSVANLQGSWWGEGDDMIWVDGYKWPPDLHGTGSEDYLNQAWGMQRNAFQRNGSSIYEPDTRPGTARGVGGYQSSYVFHLENPVRFQKQIKVTIEHGHANHLGNEMASVAYWYADRPSAVAAPPPMPQRLPLTLDAQGNWHSDPKQQCPGAAVKPTEEMKDLKKQWRDREASKVTS